MFSHSGIYGDVLIPQQSRCGVVYNLTPSLRGIGNLVASSRRQQRQVPTLDESFVQGVAGPSLQCTSALFQPACFFDSTTASIYFVTCGLINIFTY